MVISGNHEFLSIFIGWIWGYSSQVSKQQNLLWIPQQICFWKPQQILLNLSNFRIKIQKIKNSHFRCNTASFEHNCKIFSWYDGIKYFSCPRQLYAYLADWLADWLLIHNLSIQTKPHWFISFVSAQGCTHLWAHIAAHNCERTLPHTIISAKWSKSSEFFSVFCDSQCCKHLFATHSVWLSD